MEGPSLSISNDQRLGYFRAQHTPITVQDVEGEMSLHIYIAHTGQRLEVDPVAIHSLEQLRSWTSSASSIPPQDLILLTTRGKHVKLQTLLTEKEIFAFDRGLFSPDSQHSADVPSLPIPEPYEPRKFPSDLSNRQDLRSWQELFFDRQEWTAGLLKEARGMYQTLSQYDAEQTIVHRGVKIATNNHDGHIKAAEKKLEEARAWFKDVSQEQEDNLANLSRDLYQLKTIPAKRDFLQFVSFGADAGHHDGSLSVSSTNITLYEYVDGKSVQAAAAASRDVSRDFETRLSNMKDDIGRAASDYQELLDTVSKSESRSSGDDAQDPSDLIKELEEIVKRVRADCEHVASLPPKPIAQVSKMALLHTRNFLPGIRSTVIEISQALHRAVQQKNAAVENAVASMRSIATIESMLSAVNSELGSLDIPAEGLEAFELLAVVSRLPYVYGSLQLEALRRHEWSEKMKHDSALLAEEMAGYQEEEERRRKKWFKTISDFVKPDAFQDKALGFEINVRGQERGWPSVAREDVEEYLRVLRGLQGMQTTVDSLTQAYKELDRATKAQIKRAKNFKMGSVHDGEVGKSSLMLRGEDQMRILQDSNAKLEEELKGSKSRIRKLEGLVHQQSHTNRLSIGSAFQNQIPSPEVMSPNALSASPRIHDTLSRRSSVSSRRLSANQAQSEKTLVRKMLELEENAITDKAARASLEQDLAARIAAAEDLERQIEEVNLTKKNIMENMAAQLREFSEERRSWEDEISKAKSRNEELEDELDRILGSRDTEQHGAEQEKRTLLAEFEQSRNEAAKREAEASKRIEVLEAAARTRAEADHTSQAHLRVAYGLLASQDITPADTEDIAAQLEDLAQRTNEHVQQLKDAVASAKSANGGLQEQIETLQSDGDATKENHEAAIRQMQEAIDTGKADIASLASELADERKHLADLRAKFAEGETGSEALRDRVAQEELKVLAAERKLSEARSHVNGLDVELLSQQKRYAALEKSAGVATEREKQRSLHAKNLTQHIYAQNDRLLRLLETLGYAISNEDGKMIVQRISKTGNSTILPDPNSTRSVASPSPTRGLMAHTGLENSTDLNFLSWMETESPTTEGARYASFLSQISSFNIDTFTDAVLKRMKDFEHTARKWQKEARNYRDRSHHLKAESHEKIAYKSFKEGDLALFLPTRNQATRPWAAFNVGAPHYFLRETDNHKLHNREWLVARISKIEEHVVDMAKSLHSTRGADGSLNDSASLTTTADNDNPFELSDGLRWYMLDASEEKPGAPSTPGLGKTTVASANVDARGMPSVRTKPGKSGKEGEAGRALNKSLDSRRSSQNSSRKSVLGAINPLRQAGSNEVLVEDAPKSPLRSAATPAGEGAVEQTSEEFASPPLEPSTPSRLLSKSSLPSAHAALTSSARASPSKASPSKQSPLKSTRMSPTKSPTKQRSANTGDAPRGLWHSLLKVDLSVQRDSGSAARDG